MARLDLKFGKEMLAMLAAMYRDHAKEGYEQAGRLHPAEMGSFVSKARAQTFDAAATLADQVIAQIEEIEKHRVENQQ